MSKLKKNELVKNIMTKSPETVNEHTKISEAAALILEKKCHHLPVVSGSKLKGIFTNTDLMRIDFADSFGQDRRQSLATLDASKSILDVCTTEVDTLKERDTAQDAARKFAGGQFHALPVVDDAGDLVGLLTTTDLIRFLGEVSG